MGNKNNKVHPSMTEFCVYIVENDRYPNLKRNTKRVLTIDKSGIKILGNRLKSIILWDNIINYSYIGQLFSLNIKLNNKNYSLKMIPKDFPIFIQTIRRFFNLYHIFSENKNIDISGQKNVVIQHYNNHTTPRIATPAGLTDESITDDL